MAVWTVWRQLQNHKAEVLSLFAFGPVLVVLDEAEMRLGTLGKAVT